MYIEVTGQALGDMAVLNTPVFRKSSRDCSFEFWYHMRGTVLRLRSISTLPYNRYFLLEK